MTKLIDPTRLNRKCTRRETLGLFGAGGVMAVATALPRSAFAAADDEKVLTEALVLRDPDVPVTGNLQGDITIVEWSDYQCPYCRQLEPELRQVVHDDGKVRLVLKDWPILGPISVVAARMALACKFQDKYDQAHDALIGVNSKLTEPRINELLAGAGIDVDRVKRDLAVNAKTIDAILARNNDQATAFGFRGTPSFIVGKLRVPSAGSTSSSRPGAAIRAAASVANFLSRISRLIATASFTEPPGEFSATVLTYSHPCAPPTCRSSFAVHPFQYLRVHLAGIAMAEVVEFAVGHDRAGRRQRVACLPRHLDRKHPVQPAVDDVNRQAAQSFGVGNFRHQRMKRRGDRGEVGNGRGARKSRDVAERAAVAHPAQQHTLRIDVPARSNRDENAGKVRRVGIVAHQRPGRAGRGRRDQDRAMTAGVAQPAPQKAAAVAAAAMQRHHQRPGAVGGVVFRHIEREAAATAGLVVVVHDSGVAGRRLREPRQQIGILARSGIEEETGYRRKSCRQGIERLLRPRRITQRAKHRDQIAVALLYGA